MEDLTEEELQNSAGGQDNSWVPLDKSEVSVKGIIVLSGAMSIAELPERLRTKTLGISP